MAGEYQLAKDMLQDAFAAIKAQPDVDAQTFGRALLHELLEHFRTSRSPQDIISELEDHIRFLEDPDNPVVTRGC